MTLVSVLSRVTRQNGNDPAKSRVVDCRHGVEWYRKLSSITARRTDTPVGAYHRRTAPLSKVNLFITRRLLCYLILALDRSQSTTKTRSSTRKLSLTCRRMCSPCRTTVTPPTRTGVTVKLWNTQRAPDGAEVIFLTADRSCIAIAEQSASVK